MNFADRLYKQIEKCNNPTVAGLDPKVEYVPAFIRKKYENEYGKGLKACAMAILEFNKKILDALCGIVPAVKPQLAYYEMYGTEGVAAFAETVKYAGSKGFIVIADGKRNDIGSTASCYADAYLGQSQVDGDIYEKAFEADALTVNPYLGTDGIKPFTDICAKEEKGIFILVKTSNPSSKDLQDLDLQNGKKLYEHVAELVNSWGENLVGLCGYSSVGAVVGATYPEEAAVLRSIMKNAFFLVPGFGAQGGGGKDVAPCFDKNGKGAVVNASRSIICAYSSAAYKEKYTHDQFDMAAREEAIRMRDEILRYIN